MSIHAVAGLGAGLDSRKTYVLVQALYDSSDLVASNGGAVSNLWIISLVDSVVGFNLPTLGHGRRLLSDLDLCIVAEVLSDQRDESLLEGC